MKKLLIIFPILLLLLTGCLDGPAVIHEYSNASGKENSKLKTYIYKIIVEGDNFDPIIGNIALDRITIFLLNNNCGITINDKIFENNVDLKNPVIPDEIKEKYDLILFFVIRTKDLGYSLESLKDKKSLSMNFILFNGKGELLNTVLYSKEISYSLSSAKNFYNDLDKVLESLKKYINKK